MVDAARHLRQMLLAEIGAEGQARIEAGVARLSGEVEGEGSCCALAHEVAVRYARGAGFTRVAPGAIDIDALAPRALLKSEAARQVLAGSRAALAAIRQACRISARGRPS